MLRKLYDNRKHLIFVIFIIYLFAVLALTFIVRETMVLRTPENRGVVLQPFREFKAMIEQPDHRFWFMQIFLNILLFVPFGALLPCIDRRFRNPFLTVFAGFMFSGYIEFMQYITGRGLTEVDDVITNTAGAAVGLIVYYAARAFFSTYDGDGLRADLYDR